jgi:hypothetical protein
MSQSTSQKSITDPILEPYFIGLDPYCYIVYEKMPGGKGYNTVVGHYKNVGSCLNVIAKKKIDSQDYDSVEKYLSEFKKIQEQLNKIAKIDENA